MNQEDAARASSMAVHRSGLRGQVAVVAEHAQRAAGTTVGRSSELGFQHGGERPVGLVTVGQERRVLTLGSFCHAAPRAPDPMIRLPDRNTHRHPPFEGRLGAPTLSSS